jgi:hypothetical protein
LAGSPPTPGGTFGLVTKLNCLSIVTRGNPQIYASVAISSDLLEDESCAIFMSNAVDGSLSALIILFLRVWRSISPGSKIAIDCWVAPELVVFSVLVVVVVDCADTAMKSICGVTIKLSIKDNIATKVILKITLLFNLCITSLEVFKKYERMAH